MIDYTTRYADGCTTYTILANFLVVTVLRDMDGEILTDDVTLHSSISDLERWHNYISETLRTRYSYAMGYPEREHTVVSQWHS